MNMLFNQRQFSKYCLNKKIQFNRVIKKVCAILLLITLFLNSNILTICSIAVEDLNLMSNSNAREKISMSLSYNQLTNKVQNEIVITGVLETDTQDSKLFENTLE